MGNSLSNKTSAAANASTVNNTKVNIDDIDLASLDESKSSMKENKKIRKSKEYKSLRALARSGIDAERRFEVMYPCTFTVAYYIYSITYIVMEKSNKW